MAASVEYAKQDGENAYWVKPERPGEITRDGLLRVTFQEHMQHVHGEREMVSVREYEVPGVLAILKACPDMDVRQALSDLRCLD